MLVTVGQLRYRILYEAKLPNYNTWVLDAWNAVRDEFEAEAAVAVEPLDMNIGHFQGAEKIRGLFSHMGADPSMISRAMRRYYANPADEPVSERDSVFIQAGRLDPQHPIELIVGRKGKRYVYEPFNVTVTDLEGTIGHTVGDDPSDVWCFDPQTLELLFVPTFRQALYKKCRCARRSDIEGGRI